MGFTAVGLATFELIQVGMTQTQRAQYPFIKEYLGFLKGLLEGISEGSYRASYYDLSYIPYCKPLNPTLLNPNPDSPRP